MEIQYRLHMLRDQLMGPGKNCQSAVAKTRRKPAHLLTGGHQALTRDQEFYGVFDIGRTVSRTPGCRSLEATSAWTA